MSGRNHFDFPETDIFFVKRPLVYTKFSPILIFFFDRLVKDGPLFWSLLLPPTVFDY